MNDYPFGFDAVVDDDVLWDKFDRFKEAYVEALIEDEEIDDADEWYDGSMTSLWHQVHMNADFIISGRPQYLDRALDQLGTSFLHVSGSFGEFAGVYAEIDAWDARTALQFRQGYVDKYYGVRQNQLTVLRELSGIIGGFRQIMAVARRDFEAVLDAVIESCEDYEKTDGGSNGISTAFQVIGIAATVAGVVAAGLALGPGSITVAGTLVTAEAIGGGATIVGGLAGLAAEATGSSEPALSQPGSFGSAHEILVNFQRVTDALCERMVVEADAVIELLNDHVTAVGDGRHLILDQPTLTSLTPAQYRTEFPYVGDANDMTVDLFNLWLAGARRMPLVATFYADASQELEYADTRVLLGIGNAECAGSGARENIEFLLDVVRTRFGHNRDNLVAIGGALVSVAQDYSTTDEGGAQALNDMISDHVGVYTDIPAPPPQVTVPDIGQSPDPAEVPEAPGNYAPPSTYIEMGPYMQDYIIPDMPEEEYADSLGYDVNGPHGGNTRPAA